MNGVSFFVSVVFVFRGDLRGIKVENHATQCRMASIITIKMYGYMIKMSGDIFRTSSATPLGTPTLKMVHYI